MPKEADTYDQAKKWRGLLTKLTPNTQLQPDWNGKLTDFTDKIPERNIELTPLSLKATSLP